MKEVSRAQFARMSAIEREVYLKELFDDGSDSDANGVSDSEDEDWVPQSISKLPASDIDTDGEGSEIFKNTGGNVDDDAGQQETEPDNSESEESDEAEGSVTDSFIAKDKTVWKVTPPHQHQVGAHNGLQQSSGPHRSTEPLSIGETFKEIFNESMVDIIVRYTNEKALSTYAHYNECHPNSQRQWNPVTIPEIYSFFAILICAGANNSNTDHTFDMWHSTSYPLYRATMGINRFHNIMRFLRFDDNNTRTQRKKDDKAAPIRDLWTMLNANLSQLYTPTRNLTIEEQLYPCRGRGGFTQYIPSKSAKYGIKIWWICDAKNAYPLQGIIDTGKTNNTCNQGESVVKELASTYRGSGRNICMDSSFTSLLIAKHLLSWNLTMVGKIKRNKPYIPSIMAANKSRERYSTVFAFHEKVTMCSYVPKKNKAVILMSTMPSDKAVREDIIDYYNKCMTGVDTLDQMVRRYTSQRQSSRWSLALFFNMLDIASLASYIIYYENNEMITKKKTARRTFMRKLSEELAKPMIELRMVNLKVMRNYTTKIAVESIIGRQIITQHSGLSTELDKTGRRKVTGSCHICNQQTIKVRRKTRKRCAECEQPVCTEHSANIVKCIECNILLVPGSECCDD